MSKSESMAQKPEAISLADEEAVKQVLIDSVLGLWDVVNNLTRLQAVQARALSGDDLRLGAGEAGDASPTKRPNGSPPRWRRWAATSSPAAARA